MELTKQCKGLTPRGLQLSLRFGLKRKLAPGSAYLPPSAALIEVFLWPP